jgi:hypothetical protein
MIKLLEKQLAQIQSASSKALQEAQGILCQV